MTASTRTPLHVAEKNTEGLTTPWAKVIRQRLLQGDPSDSATSQRKIQPQSESGVSPKDLSAEMQSAGLPSASPLTPNLGVGAPTPAASVPRELGSPAPLSAGDLAFPTPTPSPFTPSQSYPDRKEDFLVFQDLLDSNLFQAESIRKSEQKVANLLRVSTCIISVGGTLVIVWFITGLPGVVGVVIAGFVCFIYGLMYASKIDKTASAYLSAKQCLIKEMKKQTPPNILLQDCATEHTRAQPSELLSLVNEDTTYLLFKMVDKVHQSSLSSSLKQQFYLNCENYLGKPSGQVGEALLQISRSRGCCGLFSSKEDERLKALWDEVRKPYLIAASSPRLR